MTHPERVRNALPDKDGTPTYLWALTEPSLSDTVKLIAKPCVLPVIFVPGMMGSNLRSKATKKSVWRMDTFFGQMFGLLWSTAMKGPGQRQKTLHPDLVEVDPDGAVPGGAGVGAKATLRARGWGSVGESSYKAFLVWLEEHLNQVPPNPARWPDFFQGEATIGPMSKPNTEPKLSPGVRMGIEGEPFSNELPFEALKTDDLLARARFNMPVHAFGYNWLGSCKDAARLLAAHIDEVIKSYDRDPFWCRQVVLVTHSMGGLVARSCTQMPGMADKIAGIVHGVMPAIGAAAAYRRCKVGMLDESLTAGLVIGSNGQEVTAVFAQAPGTLQLLPTAQYSKGWLRLAQTGFAPKAWPAADPYEEIYRQGDTWWGLIREEWLSPTSGAPIDWTTFLTNVDKAEAFHQSIAGKYHLNTFVFYGKDPELGTFEQVTWRMTQGLAPDKRERPSLEQVASMSPNQVRSNGSTTAYVGGKTEVIAGEYPVVYETSYWKLDCESHDGIGDGTVPTSSGKAPQALGGAGVKQQFGLTGFGHEPAYKNASVRRATLYSITKIAAAAKHP